MGWLVADNVQINLGQGGAVIAADEISSVAYQRIKLIYGADGVNSGDVAAANPLPAAPPYPSVATCSTAAGTTASVTFFSSNASRKGASVFNDSTAVLYLKHGTTAASTDFTAKLNAAEFYELPFPPYTGRIDAIWVSATGTAKLTEHT